MVSENKIAKIWI